MGRIILPDAFGPPPIMSRTLAQASLLEKYERLLKAQSEVLAAMCAHSSDLARGKKVGLVQDGFKIPFAWTADVPLTCQVDFVVDRGSGEIVVKLVRPRPVVEAKSEFAKPDEQKRLEDEGLA